MSLKKKILSDVKAFFLFQALTCSAAPAKRNTPTGVFPPRTSVFDAGGRESPFIAAQRKSRRATFRSRPGDIGCLEELPVKRVKMSRNRPLRRPRFGHSRSGIAAEIPYVGDGHFRPAPCMFPDRHSRSRATSPVRREIHHDGRQPFSFRFRGCHRPIVLRSHRLI